MSSPYVSVVVVAYKAENEIIECLDSLTNQTYLKDYYEIIVVVDDETTYEVIKNYPIIVHYRKTKGNIPSARNLGIRLSKGEIIAYTDSDCVVPANWLENIVQSFRKHSRISGVGGPIKPYSKDAVSLSLALLNMVGYSSGSLSFEKQFPTSNAAYKKEVLDLVGGFDEKALVGEDIDLYRRIKEKKFYLLFNPSMYIYHKHRTTLNSIFKWCFNVKKRSYYISKKNPSYRSLFWQILPALVSILGVIFFSYLFGKNMLLLSVLLVLFLVYLFVYLKYHRSEYLNLYSFCILPFVVLTISLAFLCGFLWNISIRYIKNN